MIGFSSLLLWASLSIGGASAGCFSPLSLTLKPEVSNEGWNDLGRGFLNGFTPDKLTDEHWEMIGKIYRDKDYMLIKGFAMTMGGLVFLVVVAVLLILCFCAAPIALCVFSCTCKKKVKLGTKSQSNIILYSGIGCNSLAMLTIALSILFCYLSLSSLTDGIRNIEPAVKILPGSVENAAAKLKEQLMGCGVNDLMSNLKSTMDALPDKISGEVSKIPELEQILKIDFEKKKEEIKGFGTRAGELGTDLKAAEDDPTLQNPLLATVAASVKTALATTREKIDEVKQKLEDNSPTSINKKLDDVNEKKKLASKSEIEKKIKEKMEGSSDKIDKAAKDIKSQIEGGFSNIKMVKEKVSSVTDKIIEYVKKADEHLGSLQAVNLVLIPCYLALASAIWSTCQATKLAKKKKAKRREKTGLLIPLAIGITLAFLPLLTSTAFMMAAGVSNVACGTVFQDDSFNFLPMALSTFNQSANYTIKGITLDIPSIIKECRGGTNLMTIFKAESKLPEDMIIKKFDVKGKKAEMKRKLIDMDFGLPKDSDWDAIQNEFNQIKTKQVDAKAKIDALKAHQMPAPLTGPAWEQIPKVKTIVDKMETFMKDVDEFVKRCEEDVATAKALKESDLKEKMVKIMVGDETATPPTSGLMDDMFTKMNSAYLKFRSDLLTESLNCQFIVPFFKDVETVVCDQALGGLNGAYAAIGLAVMSFFSAAVGTVLIWHSFRAGRGPQVEEKTGSGGSKKNKKKGKKGEGEEEVGEQGTPVGPAKSDPPSQPIIVTITHPNGVVVQADPAATGEKTNPSLLPPDVLPADPAAAGSQPDSSGPTPGTPVSPNPIQMVHMETKTEGNEPKSQTGPGGETAGGTNTA